MINELDPMYTASSAVRMSDTGHSRVKVISNYGMLTGSEIANSVNLGDIVISDFNTAQLNPNSYNLTMGDTLRTFKTFGPFKPAIDSKCPPKMREIKIPQTGVLLKPGRLYLASTVEKVSTNEYVPIITGRSSVGRLGIKVHQEAGFGDIGFSGNWTLQISVLMPTRIYPNMQLCQVYFLTTKGYRDVLYNGKYQNANGIQETKYI